MEKTRAPYQPDAKSLLGFIEPFRGHTEAPRWGDFTSVAEALVAELRFAEARGLAVGLVEAGYIEVPFAYTVHEALDAAYRKARAQIEFDKGCDQETTLSRWETTCKRMIEESGTLTATTEDGDEIEVCAACYANPCCCQAVIDRAAS